MSKAEPAWRAHAKPSTSRHVSSRKHILRCVQTAEMVLQPVPVRPRAGGTELLAGDRAGTAAYGLRTGGEGLNSSARIASICCP